MFLLLIEVKAQGSSPILTSKRVKEDFTQRGYEPQLVTAWGKDNELIWEPQWSALFPAQIEGKETWLVPMLPILQAKSTHKSLPFKLIGARRYIAVAGESNALIYQFLTLTYDDKKNIVQKADSKLFVAFNGAILRQAIGSTRATLRTYENGQHQAVVSKGSINKLGSASLSTNGVICDDVFMCYWSTYCSFDDVTYGTMTSDKLGCAPPFAPAGPCYISTWTLTDSSSYPDCYYDKTDFNPDFGPGPIPVDRPCPGDPLVAMNIAPTTPGNSIRGGTFGMTRHLNGLPKFHQGIDLEATPGTPVYTAIAGEVIGIEKSFAPGQYKAKSYGNYVYIKNVDGTYSKYNHLNEVGNNLYIGALINRGVQIGLSGATGNAAYVLHKHVHLQMFDSSRKPIDPQSRLGTPFDMKTGKGRRPC